MVPIKVNIEKVENGSAFLSVEANGTRREYQAKIVDSGGIFGIEYPPELGSFMNDYPAESKKLVGEIRSMI